MSCPFPSYGGGEPTATGMRISGDGRSSFRCTKQGMCSDAASLRADEHPDSAVTQDPLAVGGLGETAPSPGPVKISLNIRPRRIRSALNSTRFPANRPYRDCKPWTIAISASVRRRLSLTEIQLKET